MKQALLNIENLRTYFYTDSGVVKAVDDVDLSIKAGTTLAIVGESGSGKSMLASSIMQLIPRPPGKIVSGKIFFQDQDLLDLSEKEMRHIRGNRIAMIFQEPMTSLNPVFRISRQIEEVITVHQNVKKDEAKELAVELLQLVGIPAAKERMSNFPHQLSGGMRQRVMIAMALACEPQLIIADEPTTALDVTVQAQILELLKGLKDSFQTAIILITHDLGVVAGQADRILVMYAGQIVESGTYDEVLKTPLHPYTWGLLKSVPRLDAVKGQKLTPIWGQPPDLLQRFSSCPFAPRCDFAMEICAREIPPLFNGGRARCWLNHPQAPEVKFKKGVS